MNRPFTQVFTAVAVPATAFARDAKKQRTMKMQPSLIVKLSLVAVVVMVVALAIGGNAQATPIAPDSVTASTEFSGADKRLAVDCINGNGLTAGMHTNADYNDTTPGPGAGQDIYWLATSKDNQWIDFAFNAAQLLDGMHVWNYSEWQTLARGVSQTDIEFYRGGNLVATLTAQTLTQAPSGGYTGGSPTYAGESYSFGQTILADHVKFTNMTNWGGDLIGLSEIRFNAVPEIDPAMGGSALSLVAGVLAMIEQRRRRATLVA